MNHTVQVEKGNKYTFSCYYLFTDIYPRHRYLRVNVGGRYSVFDLKKIKVKSNLMCTSKIKKHGPDLPRRLGWLAQLLPSRVVSFLNLSYGGPKYIYVIMGWEQLHAGKVGIEWDPVVQHYMAQLEITNNVQRCNYFPHSGPMPDV